MPCEETGFFINKYSLNSDFMTLNLYISFENQTLQKFNILIFYKKENDLTMILMWDDLGNIQRVTSLHGWMRLKPIVDPVIT